MKSNFDFQRWLPLGLVVLAGLILFFGLRSSPPDLSSAEQMKKAQNAVNEHLRRTAEQIEMQKRQMSIRNWQLVNEFDRTVVEKPYTPPKEGTELQEQNSAKAVARDLGVDAPPPTLPNNPADLVQHQLFEAEVNRKSSDAYRKEYARQFIENARRGGWELKLSDDYRVISAKRIRQPSANY